MKQIKLFSGKKNNNESYKYYYSLGRLNKDGSAEYFVAGGCSDDEADIGEKVKVELFKGKFKYLVVIGKTEYKEVNV